MIIKWLFFHYMKTWSSGGQEGAMSSYKYSKDSREQFTFERLALVLDTSPRLSP